MTQLLHICVACFKLCVGFTIETNTNMESTVRHITGNDDVSYVLYVW